MKIEVISSASTSGTVAAAVTMACVTVHPSPFLTPCHMRAA
eukprot:CAMPEP_0185392834 /NCGR_PEP_ID=MMETSP1364-20130426/77276_1 /TAXON_ID=38817 /ORGANISM="Gephyrocapsa oceanica, Strain RCC1303" /LENGTH=40 /DNA_ID= /DNA_START= /DNA_END= /DNA_ORIENTATION=